MALSTGREAQLPWLNSPAIGGEFIYRPKTDEIVLRNGHHYARPRQIQANSLRAATYDGPLPIFEPKFEYFGTPPGGAAANFVFDNNRPQDVAQPMTRSGHLPVPRAPLISQEREQSIRQTGLLSTRTTSRKGLTQFIRSQDDRNVVFATSTESQTEQGRTVPQPGKGTRGIPINNGKLLDALFPKYRPRGPEFFSVGRIFMILFSEPLEGASTVTSWERGTMLASTGGIPFTRKRCFVIIHSGPRGSTHSWALPIGTYGGQGVAKPGVMRSDHCIIYSSTVAPRPTQDELPRRGESGMQPTPIHVSMNSPAERLDPMSRINLAVPTQFDHNNSFRDFGRVSEQSAHDLQRQFRNVWGNRPLLVTPRPAEPPGPPRPQRAPRDEEESEEDGDEDDVDDDDDDDDDSSED